MGVPHTGIPIDQYRRLFFTLLQHHIRQPTANRTGFDMGVPTFRWAAWAEAHTDAADRLLDVGSGLGTNALAALTERGRAVVAVDPSPNHLEHLREAAAEAGVPDERLWTGASGPMLLD
jgi:SAM-dependent methyltransferase